VPVARVLLLPVDRGVLVASVIDEQPAHSVAAVGQLVLLLPARVEVGWGGDGKEGMG
jgi:hypothetical protein